MSPKYAILRHTTKAPNGAVISERMMPVSQAGKRISNIMSVVIEIVLVPYGKCYRAYRAGDCDGVYKQQYFWKIDRRKSE